MQTTDLNSVMAFDHVIEVHADGSITDGQGYAPDLFNGELFDSSGWELLDGYSGQDSYSGPVMHNSEFIGGQLERDILARPGRYVAIVCYWDNDDTEDGDMEVEGWAVAYRPS